MISEHLEMMLENLEKTEKGNVDDIPEMIRQKYYVHARGPAFVCDYWKYRSR